MRYQPHKIPRNKEEWLFNMTVNAAIYQGASVFFTYVINQNLKLHYRDIRAPPQSRHFQSYRGPTQMQRWGKTMGTIALSPATPVVAAVVGAGVGVVATSVVYEQSVNKSIRKGRQGFWFGPFVSGFGSVV